MRNDDYSKIGLINDQGYIFTLEREITMLKEENDALKAQIREASSLDIPVHKAAERERVAMIAYIEELNKNLHGIPAVVKILREVLDDVARKVEVGEHINVELNRRFKR
jgi:predicted  nucleic acid-binding Zn-ribbon protein